MHDAASDTSDLDSPFVASAAGPSLAEFLAARGYRPHALTRTAVGHLHIVGSLNGEPIDMLVDTGAASTIVDEEYCRARGIALTDTGHLGGGAGGAALPVHALGDVVLTLDGEPIRGNGICAIDMSHANAGLRAHGASPVQAVLGADVLTRHQAVIDYTTLTMYLLRPAAEGGE